MYTAKMIHSVVFLELITTTDSKLFDCSYVACRNRACVVEYLLEADIKRHLRSFV